jgi:hypothetical protein
LTRRGEFAEKCDFSGVFISSYSATGASMAERELYAEIVKSGTWLYDGLVPADVWIVKQNFEYHFEEEYSGEPEKLNEDSECFSVVIARNGGGEPDGAPQFSQFA